MLKGLMVATKLELSQTQMKLFPAKQEGTSHEKGAVSECSFETELNTKKVTIHYSEVIH